MRKLLLAALVLGMLNSASASPMADDESLQVFAQIVLYNKACGVDPAVTDLRTFAMMAFLLKMRPQADRELIGQRAQLVIKTRIAAAGLPGFCAAYGPEIAPKLRALNESWDRYFDR
jgi:hypothetical protein